MASSRAQTEQQQLAANLASGKPNLIMFYSSQCTLCSRLSASINQSQPQANGTTRISRVCVDDDVAWGPELLHFNIKKVPCLVLTNAAGSVVAQTETPVSYEQMHACMQHMLGWRQLLHQQ